MYLALGVNTDGHKDLLGMWMSENEGSKFWLSVLTELKNRGLKDILIACVDGLKGFPDAINTIYPDTHIQLCIIHMVRTNLKYVSWKDYKAVTADLKKIYSQTTLLSIQDSKKTRNNSSTDLYWFYNDSTISSCYRRRSLTGFR